MAKTLKFIIIYGNGKYKNSLHASDCQIFKKAMIPILLQGIMRSGGKGTVCVVGRNRSCNSFSGEQFSYHMIQKCYFNWVYGFSLSAVPTSFGE